ncbi:MAG: hypothetical protein ABEI31_04390 [Halodesulfurarchaeum sp.]
MVSSRLATAALGVAVSLGLTLLAWQYFGSPVFLLFVPFVPFLFRRRDSQQDAEGPTQPSIRTCPECGFTTRDPDFQYCPRDGRELRRQ